MKHILTILSKSFPAIFWLAIFSIFTLKASSQEVRGKVVDGYGEEIPFVNVYVLPSKEPVATTDFTGDYSVTLLPGKSTLEFSFVGYNTKQVEVEIKDKETVELNVILQEGEGVVIDKGAEIIAKANRGSEGFLDSLAFKSGSTVSVVGNTEMSLRGDSKADDAVSRVSGVSSVGGIISVRGLSDRYVKTLLNGMELPTLDPFRNNVRLDAFPTGLIDNIIITKTMNPELIGDWSGAYMSIQTKDYPSDLVIKISSSVGYNTNATFNEIISSKDGSTDWLGYDDGARGLPDGVTFNQENFPTRYTVVSVNDQFEVLGLYPQLANIDVSAYTGQSVKFRLNGTTAYSWKGDIAVDQFCVVESVPGCTDPAAGNYDPLATIDDGSCVDFTCSATVTVPYCMSFESGLGDWNQSSDDDIDWSLNSGMTASWGTGPDAASDGTEYLYVEASYPNFPYKTAIVNTPCFDLTAESAASMSFDYNMFGAFVGSVYVQASTDGVVWDYVWWETGDQGEGWNAAAFDLSAYAGQTVQLRFIGQTNHGWQGDMAIDNVCVSNIGLRANGREITAEDIAELDAMLAQTEATEDIQAPEFSTMSAKVYPNPSRKGGEVAIELADLPEGITAITVSVVDLLGKEVMNSQIAAFSTNQTEYVQLHGSIESGTYLVRMIAGNQTITERLIIAE